MLTPGSQSRSSHSLRLGAVLFTMLASLGACATAGAQRYGFASPAVADSSELRWGFAAEAEPSQLTHRGFATVAESPQPERWGFVEVSTEASPLQASRATVPTSAQR